MLSSLSFLIHGKATNVPKRTVKELQCLFLISKNLPARDSNGNPLSVEELADDLEKRLVNLDLTTFRPVVFEILDKLKSHDEILYYFVLVSTFRLPDEKFAESLKDLSVEQNLMFRIDGNYKHRLYSKPLEQNNVPQLAWDITSVLKSFKIAEKDQPLPLNDLTNVNPIDEWGLISHEYRSILKSEELRLSSREGKPIEYCHLNTVTFYKNLLDMHRGISSDLFQLDSDNHFYQSRHCRVENWNLTTTRTILQKHIYLANILSEAVFRVKDHFVNVSATDNSIRLMMQKYLIDEHQLFFEYCEHLLGNSIDPRFEYIISSLPTIDLENSDRFQVCDEVYEVASAYSNVIKEMNHVLRNINDYSPISLNELSFIGSQSAPQQYSLRMWRRLNVALIRFIVNKLAEMLTTPDAELLELLTDAGDSKAIKDPSIWQRLNPLQMESSQCLDDKLTNRVSDLIIGYQFFVNDKKNISQKLDGETFAKSNIQDAEELELFAKTSEFENIIEGILEKLDVNSTSDHLDELSNCIEELLEKIPTTTLVEKYSQIVLEKSVRFFEFLKKFFTSAYIHLQNQKIQSSRSFLNIMEQEKMHKKGYDAEFLKTVGYNMKSTIEDSLLTVDPPEPLNVFVSTGVTEIYSEVFTVLNMLHTALEAVMETKDSDTLKREPRLRHAFCHMNTTVFAIRKNMLNLVEASYETLMKTLDFKSSSESRSSHELLNVCYRAHRRFIRDVAGAIMYNSKRGTTRRVIRLMVSNVSQSSQSCIKGDAVGAEKHYQEFQNNLIIFLDQCRIDHIRYPLYRSLEIGSDETDGRRSLHSSYSDDLSCRSY